MNIINKQTFQINPTTLNSISTNSSEKWLIVGTGIVFQKQVIDGVESEIIPKAEHISSLVITEIEDELFDECTEIVYKTQLEIDQINVDREQQLYVNTFKGYNIKLTVDLDYANNIDGYAKLIRWCIAKDNILTETIDTPVLDNEKKVIDTQTNVIVYMTKIKTKDLTVIQADSNFTIEVVEGLINDYTIL